MKQSGNNEGFIIVLVVMTMSLLTGLLIELAQEVSVQMRLTSHYVEWLSHRANADVNIRSSDDDKKQ